jgi:RsiW-degrading membrane proteinase PrsW (M82 family)
MQALLQSIKRFIGTFKYQIFLFSALPASQAVQAAMSPTDLTTDKSGGQDFGQMASRLDDAAQIGATLLISLVAIGGFVVIAISLYTLWKASKDEREKPMSAIVGLFIGGAMAGVSSVMWIFRNTVVGTGT